MLSPEQAAKLREKLFGGGIALPTMGSAMPVPIASGAPPVAPAAAAPPPMPPTPAGPSGLTGALLKAGEKIEAQKTAEEERVAGLASIMPPAAASNGGVGPVTLDAAKQKGGGVAPLMATMPNAAPTIGAPGPKPPGSMGLVTDKLMGNPMLAKVMAKLDAKGYGGGPGAGALAGAGAGPKGPAPDLRHRMYLPGEIAQQDATTDYLKKSGELDEQASELAAHGKLREAVLMRNAAEEAEQMQAEAEAREKERLDYVQGQISMHDQQAEELAKQKVDPDHFWKNKGDGAKVGAMVAMFFAGFGNKGQAEMLMNGIQRKIDADVDAQKTNIAQGWRGLAEERSIFQQRLGALQDERQAEASAKASYWDGIALTAQAHALETSSDMEKVNAEKLALAAQFKADSYKNDIQKGAEEKFAALEARKAAAAAAGANELKKQNAEDRKALLSIAVKDIEVNGGKLAFSPDGAPGIIRDGVFVPAQGTTPGGGASSTATLFGSPNAKGQVGVAGNAPAKSKEDAQKLDELGQNYADAMKLLTDMENHVDNVGTTYNPWGNAADKSDELQSKLFGKIKGMAAAKGGSPGSSENDAKILMKQIPSPGAFWSGDAKARLQKLKDDLANEYENGKKALLAPAAQPSNPLSLGKPQ